MQRREFITLLGGSAAVWPLGARSQQPTMPVIGLLSGTDREIPQFAAFRQGLNEIGYVEGRNVAFEYRWAEGHPDRLSALAADLVRRNVTVMVTIQGAAAALAAKAATATIPIVFSIGGDPVRFGLVSSLNQPGGNVTGTSFLFNTLGGKRLELLRDLMPSATLAGLLVNPKNPASESETSDIRAAALALGLQLYVQNASSDHEIESAFVNFVQQGVNGLTFAADALFYGNRDQIVLLAAQHGIPTIYFERDFAVAGGLMSYSGSITDAYRLAGIYTGRILKGEKPARLPVIQSTKIELVINMKTAKALGLAFPLPLLGRADEVIE